MAFPKWMRRQYGAMKQWTCEMCNKEYKEGFAMEMHHILPTHAGGADTFENAMLLCVSCHYHAHLYLNARNQDHPASAGLILARLRKYGGRTRKWLKENKK